MKIRLESSLFKERIIEKIYSKDFRSDKLNEELINLNNASVLGYVHEIQLDGFCVLINDLQTSSGYSVGVCNNFSLFRLHFELEGHYHYTPANSSEALVVIPEGHFNLFYLPETEGICRCREKCTKSLEILFTNDFIEKAAGKDYRRLIRRMGGISGGTESFLLWEESMPLTNIMQQNIQEIIHCPYEGQIKKTFLEAKITGLLISLLVEKGDTSPLAAKTEDPAGTDHAGLLKVEEYIRKNLKEPITIADLATIAGFNTSKLKHNFKKTFSTTIFKYITRLRMEKAKELIQHDKLSITEASYEIGYKNPQHFTVAFKKFYGYLPSSLADR